MAQAVIDIGTNTLILLIAQYQKGKLDVLHDEAHITRLGQGLNNNHFFIPQAMDRTLTVLEDFKRTCDQYKVKKIKAVGTAACRQAANAQVFLNKVKERTQIDIEVVSGNQEAEFTFMSAYRDFGKDHQKVIIVDIGGGSTEFMTGPSGIDKPEAVISLPMGSVKLTEEIVTSDPIRDEEYQKLIQVIQQRMQGSLNNFFPEDFNPQNYDLIATAGTATTLKSIQLGLDEYDSEKVHGSVLQKTDLEKIIQDLAQKSTKQRQQMAGLEPLRADVILAGALLLLETLKYFQKNQTIISDRGVRYGVFYEYFT